MEAKFLRFIKYLDEIRFKSTGEKNNSADFFPQEKLQNAEDAKASEVRFILDHHSYSREKIMAPDTGKNDLDRMQVTKDIFQKHFPALISSHCTCASGVCKLLYLKSIPGWSSLCLQRRRVHREGLGGDTKP